MHSAVPTCSSQQPSVIVQSVFVCARQSRAASRLVPGQETVCDARIGSTPQKLNERNGSSMTLQPTDSAHSRAPAASCPVPTTHVVHPNASRHGMFSLTPPVHVVVVVPSHLSACTSQDASPVHTWKSVPILLPDAQQRSPGSPQSPHRPVSVSHVSEASQLLPPQQRSPLPPQGSQVLLLQTKPASQRPVGASYRRQHPPDVPAGSELVHVRPPIEQPPAPPHAGKRINAERKA